MSWDVTWRDAGALLGVATVVGGMVIGWVRWRLSGDFASKSDISGLGDRMDEIEKQLRGVPTHDDVRRLSERISAVERGVDVVGAEVRAVKEGVGRAERDLHLLVQHAINKEARGG
jgi:tetrahydromethanopterin S-methyltransferase subunit G